MAVAVVGNGYRSSGRLVGRDRIAKLFLVPKVHTCFILYVELEAKLTASVAQTRLLSSLGFCGKVLRVEIDDIGVFDARLSRTPKSYVPYRLCDRACNEPTIRQVDILQTSYNLPEGLMSPQRGFQSLDLVYGHTGDGCHHLD